MEWGVVGLVVAGSCCLWATGAVALALAWWRNKSRAGQGPR